MGHLWAGASRLGLGPALARGFRVSSGGLFLLLQ